MCQQSDDEGRFWLRLEQDEASRRAEQKAADPKEVEKALKHHRGLIARMTDEQRRRLRESFREDGAVADGGDFAKR